MSEDHLIEQAKALLRDSLRNSSDQGIRLLAEMSEIADDHPSVVRIAAALREKAGRA